MQQPKEEKFTARSPVPEDNLIENREVISDSLTALINRFAPCVYCVDGKWGTGKTFFLKLWKSKNLDQFEIVDFSAWDYDFTSSPIAALLREIKQHEFLSVENDYGKFKEIVSKIVRVTLPLAARIGAQAFLGTKDFSSLGEKYKDAIAEGNEVLVKEFIEDFLSENSASTLFKSFLLELDKKSNKPIVFLIDELDRCKPPFAIELLEVIKHFFDDTNITFVLAVDKSSLVSSIRAVYGPEFDSRRYLERFFDFTLKIDSLESESVVANFESKLKLNELLNSSEWKLGPAGISTIKKTYRDFFAKHEINFRRQYQILNSYAVSLVFCQQASLGPEYSFLCLLMILLEEYRPETYSSMRKGISVFREGVQVMQKGDTLESTFAVLTALAIENDNTMHPAHGFQSSAKRTTVELSAQFGEANWRDGISNAAKVIRFAI